MKAMLESTTKMVYVNGIQARIWEGRTDSGVPFHAFIVRVGVLRDADDVQFAAELQEMKAPSPEIESYPMRMIL